VLAPHDQVEILRRRCVFGLTRRQLQVLGTCALGYSVEETAAALGIAKPTVFRHLELLEPRIFGLTTWSPAAACSPPGRTSSGTVARPQCGR
jgi:FixJ family two-component response regulator